MFTGTNVSAAVEAAREEFRRANENNERILKPLIDAHLAAYDALVRELEGAHQLVADSAEFDLVGKTREAARWLVLGRCIGLARASADLVRLGYASEALPTVRSLHEAIRLLDVFSQPGEEELLRRWLEDRHVSRGAIMQAIERQHEAMRVQMIRAGRKPPGRSTNYLPRKKSGLGK